MKPIKNRKSKYKKVLCPFCHSEEVIKRGKRRTKNRGLIQRYGCQKCGKRFVIDDGFFKMKNAPQKITCAMDLFFNGISTRKIQQHFKSFYPRNSSHKSIYKWIIKYSKQISKFTDRLELHSGYEIQMDEMEYSRRKTHKAKLGTDKNWFIDCIDLKTRFMISSEFVKTREQAELINVLKKAKKKTENQVTKVTTDGYTAYNSAIRATFGLVEKNKYFGVQHKIVTQAKNEGFNHKVERMHSNIRARTKIFRGFHGSISSANAIMKGLETYYNFVRVHQAIGCEPYKLALPELKLGTNKWLDLIKLANTNNIK